MRLWHEAMLPYLSKQHLQGQHRECCALRGLGWGKKHATVNYVFTHPPMWLVSYHRSVMRQLRQHHVNIDASWKDPLYRGKHHPPWPEEHRAMDFPTATNIYPEHNDAYWQECRENLKRKGFDVTHIPEKLGRNQRQRQS